eukprot:1158651-Pelagomonas_calceolata.AAC.3
MPSMSAAPVPLISSLLPFEPKSKRAALCKVHKTTVDANRTSQISTHLATARSPASWCPNPAAPPLPSCC